MLPEIGVLFLIIALINSVIYTVLPYSGVLRVSKIDPKLQFFLVFSAMICLWASIFINDFSLNYIAFHSHSELPWYYKISSLWGGHEGSLLLWLFIQQVYHLSLMKVLNNRKVDSLVIETTNRIMHAYSLSILFIICFTSNPFTRDFVDLPIDGADLNPMLQDFALIIHPPILYMGYVGTSSVFAIAVASLLHGGSSVVTSIVKTFAYVAWGFLCVGITLGSWWAYYELGWGGWWFWDPSENAALLPWLSLTALLHTLSLRQKWWPLAVILASVSFILSLIGTFLIRSGIISSVHSFALDLSKAKAFISVIACFTFFSIFVLVNYFYKRKNSKNYISRMAKIDVYIAGAVLILTTYLFSIFIGTIYPLVTKALFGYEVSVGFPYFNMLTNVLMLPAIVLIPFTLYRMKRSRYLVYIALATVTSFLVIRCFDTFSYFAFFVVLASALLIISELANINNLSRTFAHVGLGIIAVAITIVSTYEKELETSMVAGKKYEIANLDLTVSKVDVQSRGNHVAYVGELSISQEHDVSRLKKIYPEKRFYFSSNSATTEVALFVTPFYDLYVAMSEKRKDDWIFRLAYKPFVRWLWIGGLIVAMASIVYILRCSRV